MFIVFIVFSCLSLLSCTELCVLLCRLLLFVSTLAKWLAGKTYSRDIFCVEGFPIQRPNWRVIYYKSLFCVFPTRNIVNYLWKARYSLFVLKVPLNSNQSFNRSINSFIMCTCFWTKCINQCCKETMTCQFTAYHHHQFICHIFISNCRQVQLAGGL